MLLLGSDLEMIVAARNVLITEAKSVQMIILTADVYLHVILISISKVSGFSPYHNSLILVV